MSIHCTIERRGRVRDGDAAVHLTVRRERPAIEPRWGMQRVQSFRNTRPMAQLLGWQSPVHGDRRCRCSRGPGLRCGKNPSATETVSIWLWRSNYTIMVGGTSYSESRCVVYGKADSQQPSGSPRSGDPVVRWGHLDLNALNARSLQPGVWTRLVNVAPFGATTYVISKVGNYTSSPDPCGWGTSGPHLHMDGPVGATRNCSLQARSQQGVGPSYSTTTTAFEFGAGTTDMGYYVRYEGHEPMVVGSHYDSAYEFLPDDPPKRIHEIDLPVFHGLPEFEVLGQAADLAATETDRYSDLDGGCCGGH